MGIVTADDSTTYSTLTSWESIVGIGGVGGGCLVEGTIDDGGISLDYSNNMVDDPSAPDVDYVIKGSGVALIEPSTAGSTYILNIITTATIMDISFSGGVARANDQFFNTGIDIGVNQDKDAYLYRVQVYGIGESAGASLYGIKCHDRTKSTVKLQRCRIYNVESHDGSSAYGISFKATDELAINDSNKPDLHAYKCTVDTIKSPSGVAITETVGIYVTNASGYKVTESVSHEIFSQSSGTQYCFVPTAGTSGISTNYTRGIFSYNQSSDRTGVYRGTDADINYFTGAPDRPDPYAVFSANESINDLKIARGTEETDLSLNYVYKSDNIGAFAKHQVWEIGTGIGRDYSTVASAKVSLSQNFIRASGFSETGPLRTGNYRVLGYDGPYNFSYTDYSTWLILKMNNDGTFDEQISGQSTIGSGPFQYFWAGNVLTGSGKNNRTTLSPSAEGYGDSLIDLNALLDISQNCMVQHLKINTGNKRWGTAVKSSSVHNCIVYASGYWDGVTLTESIKKAIDAENVTTCLVYGEILTGIVGKNIYNNTVVLNNMSLNGTGIHAAYAFNQRKIKNNLVLTSGTNFFVVGGDIGASGNISDSRTQVGEYFTDASNNDYTLKEDSLAINSGVVPKWLSDYGSLSPPWPFEEGTVISGQSVDTPDENHWFIDGGNPFDNRFNPVVSHDTFDSGWDERYQAAPSTSVNGVAFIAFMDF